MHDIMPSELDCLLIEWGGSISIADLYSEGGCHVYEAAAMQDKHEIRELLQLTRGASIKILEFAAGSGRITLPLAASGHTVVSVDLSQSMIGLLNAKLMGRYSSLSDSIRTKVADMTAYFDGTRYSAVILGCISISLLDADERNRFFEGARSWLAPEGVLYMSTTDTSLLGAGASFTQDFPGLNGERYRLFEQVDSAESIRHVAVIDLAELEHEDLTVYLTHVRAIAPNILRDELAVAGLTVRAVHPVATPGGAHPIVILEAVWDD